MSNENITYNYQVTKKLSQEYQIRVFIKTKSIKIYKDKSIKIENIRGIKTILKEATFEKNYKIS